MLAHGGGALEDEPTIWEKIDIDEYLAAQEASRSSAAPESEAKPKTGWEKLRHRTFWIVLKVVAVVFWLYVPAKLFVGDVDRWVVENVDPSVSWLLDYRFFIFLGLAAIGLLVFKRWKYIGALLYVLVFPLSVIFFYVPRFLARQPTWMPTIGLLNILWTTLRTIRFTIPALFLFSVAALAIWLDATPGVQAAAIGLLLGLWTILIVRAFLSAVRPASFINAQQRAIGRIQTSTFAQNTIALPASHLSPEVKKLSKPEIDTLVTNASFALLFYASGYFLADQLERYRKSGASIIFSVLGVAFLYLEALVIFTLVNLGIYQLVPDQFSAATEPTFTTLIRYTLSSLQLGEINAIQPIGQVATGVSIYAGISVGVIMLTLVVALIFSVRSSRESTMATESIAEMRKESDEYASRLVNEYRLPIEELIGRFIQMGSLMNLWLRFVSDTIGTYNQKSGSDDA
jgi:hypothetical protein